MKPGAPRAFFVVNLVSGVLGPTSVALLNDHVFGREGVRYSLATLAGVGSAAALALLTAGLGAYRVALGARDRWAVVD